MKIRPKTWLKVLLGVIVVIVLGVGFWLTQQKKTVEYTGVVVDSETGLPVPNAKVVLSTWYYGFFDSNPTHVGTVTDESGSFTIGASPGYWIDDVDLSASSPSSSYCRLRNPRGKNDIRIEVSPLDTNQAGLDAFTYLNFSGGWSGDVRWLKKR